MGTERRVTAGVVAVAALVAGRLHRRRRARIGAVAPELRQPALWVPFTVNRLTLRLVRRGLDAAPASDGPPARTAPGRSGEPDVTVWVHEPSTPRSTPTGAVLWIHGGGYVMGSPVADHALCSRLADNLGALVVSVAYRLAPEHPAPAALEDCHTALAWIKDAADELGVDPARIAVAGQSAGGGLAAALAQLAHDRREVSVAAQVLIYPMLDDRTVRGADPAVGHFVWTRSSNRFGWTAYLGQDAGTGDPVPYAVPARRSDLAGLPPAWIGVGDLDLFRDEDHAYAARLRSAGVPCATLTVPGMYHAADVLCPDAPIMRDFRDAWTRALREVVMP